MKNVNEMSMWDALENIADMMIEEGWSSQAIETAEETLRRIKSDLFEVERFDATSNLSKAAGDAAWILSKVAMIVAERGFDHKEDEDKLFDLAWDIEEMWTGCGIARIEELHDTFGPWIDYHDDDDDDEKDDDAEDLVAELTENTMSREWNDNKREQLLVEFNDPKLENEGIDWEIDDLIDGWGHEKKLEDMIAEITEKDPGDWEAEFALDRMVNLGVDYLRVAEMDDRRKNKHDMFKSWAQALGCNIVTCELTDRDPGGKGVIEYADGRIAGIDVSVTYRLYENK